ncbi:MAG TPA: TMEM175 family protein [Puia sp.]|nr:TMEM175 family protein [Puia sp.]
MADKHPHPHESEVEREFELERMILFSDAVFAIAITLMVIDVKWPDIPGNLKGVDFDKLLHPTIIQFIIFVISFAFVGRAWKVHLRLFRQLRTYDQRLLNFNLLFLFFIVIFPFTASGMFAHTQAGFVYPFLFYMFNVSAVGITDFLIARYIFRIRPGLSVRGQEEEKKFILIRAKFNAMAATLAFIIMFLVAISYPGNTDNVAYAFCAYPILVFISNRRVRKFKPKTTTS